MRISEDIARKHPELLDNVSRLASGNCLLGEVAECRGRLTQAVDHYERGIELYRPALRQQPGHAEMKPHLSEAYARLSDSC